MKDQFQCPQCGCPNEMGRIFCIRCGVKLDFTRMTRSSRIDVGSIFTAILRLLVFLVVVTVAGLAVWSVAPLGQVGGEADAREWLHQRDLLKAGGSAQVEVSETTINAYLVATLKQAPTNSAEAVGRWKMRLDALNMAFRTDHVTVMALTRWGPLTITWAISGVPKLGDGNNGVDVQRGWLGHLPLPHAIAAWLADRMAVLLLVRWPQDRELWEQLNGVALNAGRITLSTRSTKPQQ